MTDRRSARPAGRTTSSGRAAVEAVWRIESARIVATLSRYTGDFALAEDLAQEALAEALVTWPRDGVPKEPAGWLLTCGKRRAIDTFRRNATQRDRYSTLAHELGEGQAAAGAPAYERQDVEVLADPDRVDDDVLALMLIACHPVVSREASVALTLRVVGGLTSDEIARAFLVPAATVQARITRAKKAIAAERVAFEVPEPGERRERLGRLLSVIYLIFTEGSSATAGDDVIRHDLAREGIRLARVLTRLMPDEAEAYGLLALLELTAARFPARVDEAGDPVLLEDQDRRRWDTAAVRRGRAALVAAQRVGRGLGPYGLQAAIAECHDIAPTAEATDWSRIVVLYDGLLALTPSPVVAVNRAVAVSMADGPAAALPLVDELIAAEALPHSHLLPLVRGELLRRLGRADEARVELATAVERCPSVRERQLLEARRDAL
ncbi:RNA polymerase sigma factor [Luteipulveratus halotolerans]|uniref:RNA polymerase sigma factor n=1 Tax=Luteipulveratus halotolerans TaxID=1631356 RepID=UPI000AEBD7A9|nr:DUF6596 domain-containing protein [Luteipulveratus halotolerans]